MLNVNRLHDGSKRQQVYDLLINRKTDIAFQQETHSKHDTVQKWKKRVGRKFHVAL